MKFFSRVRINSALPGFEDVFFTLNKMTEGRRINLRLSVADGTAGVRQILAEKQALNTESDVAKIADLLDRLTRIIEDEINPAWVRWGLHAVDGLEIDGEPATVESLIQTGPPELYAEILTAIRHAAGLSEDDQGNSASPTTSGARVDGRTSATSAPPADAPGSTLPETAASTTQNS